MSFVKKIALNLFLSTFIFLLAASPSLTLAQTQSSDDKPRVVPPDEAPLIVKINNVAYSSQKRLVSIDYTVTNNTNTFVDTLKYNFEFYNGEKLEKTGLLFRNLTYVLSTSGAVPKLSPNQSKRETIEYVVPENIPGGSYFIRGVVSNNSLSIYGVDYTKESIKLTGLGGFITNKFAGLLDLGKKTVHELLEGPTLEKDGNYVIAFPKEMNDQIFSYLEDGEIYSDLIITHTSNADEVVYEKKDIPLNSLMNEDRTGLDFKMEPWENMKSGSYTAVITFNDERGIKISENMTARLLYRGLLGRIYDVDTNINSYKKGDPANLLVNVVVAGDPEAEKFFVTAKFKNNGEVVQEMEKEVKLNKDFKGVDLNVDFSDEKIKTKTLINEVEINVVSEDGVVLDTTSIDIDTSEVFEYPEDSNLLINTLVGVLVLIGIISFLGFLKRRNKISLVNMVTGIAIVGSSVLMSFGAVALAQYESYCSDPAADYPYTYGDCTYNNQNYQPDVYCWDSAADNAYQSGVCVYNNCNDSLATNNGSPLPCTYSQQYVDGTVNNNNNGVCRDSNATNFTPYDPNDTRPENNSLCVYPPQCLDPVAINYWSYTACFYNREVCNDPVATNFGQDGACYYDPIETCDDPNALNYEEEGDCEYDPPGPELTRDLIHVYSSTPSPNSEICTVDCVDMTYYLRIQCKDCLNSAHEIEIGYYNNWKGTAQNSPSEHNLYFNFDKNTYPNTFSAWIVYDENLEKDFAISDELKAAPESKLAGWPIAANDIINQWVFGPFVFTYCSENFNEDGTIDKTLADSEGVYNQNYAIEVKTSFGGDYCQADVEGVEYGPAYEVVVDNVSCELPAEIRGIFYIDENQDGVRTSDELYLKSADASGSCLGEISPLRGYVNSITNGYFGNLSPDNCYENNTPYFLKDLLIPGEWSIGLDPANAFGFVATGIEFFVDSMWVPGDYVLLNSGDVMMARVGLNVAQNLGVSISCQANPEIYRTFPTSVSWTAEVLGDGYDVEDLTFQWTEVNATKNPSVVQKSGGINQGMYSTYYNNATGGSKDYTVKVVAKNNQGAIVSNEATCTATSEVMSAICKAYPSLQSIPNNPAEYFDYGQNVFWNVFLNNADPNITSIIWGGAAYSGGSNDNYTVGPFQYYTRGQQQIANVSVTGSSGYVANAICPIFIKQCNVNADCQNGYICNQSSFTCVLPPLEFTSPLTLNPGVVNTGELCRLSWTVDGADSCILYKNGEAVEVEGSELPSNTISVEPGTYSILCENSEGLSVTGGPVRCLVNPNIREQ